MKLRWPWRKPKAQEKPPEVIQEEVSAAEAAAIHSTIVHFAKHRKGCISQIWPNRPELGGEDFMVFQVGGTRLCRSIESAIEQACAAESHKQRREQRKKRGS